MKPHFFLSSDGCLHDTRRIDWASNPVRRDFARTYRQVNNGRELRASIRAGQWAFPGGYEIFAITSDGAALCVGCVKKEYPIILGSVRHRQRDGWQVIGFDCAANYDSGLYCDHCGRVIVDDEEDIL